MTEVLDRHRAFPIDRFKIRAARRGMRIAPRLETFFIHTFPGNIRQNLFGTLGTLFINKAYLPYHPRDRSTGSTDRFHRISSSPFSPRIPSGLFLPLYNPRRSGIILAMCGRYNIISDAPAWIVAFGLPESEESPKVAGPLIYFR